MATNPRTYISEAAIGEPNLLEAAGLDAVPLDLNKLPPGVVSGQTLIDFTAVPYPDVRAGVSLSMLFASRVATQAVRVNGGDEDDWLAEYASSLGDLGFAVSPMSVVKSSFKKTGIKVHKAIIPFLTVALGGAAIGPIILAALRNLQTMGENTPWITLFEREARRFEVREFHFAAASSTASDTAIRYAIARLNTDAAVTKILFFDIGQVRAEFESATTTLAANNSLMAVIREDLKHKLGDMVRSSIMAADVGNG